jgi:hypothetical protein
MAVPGDADLLAFRSRHEPASYLDEGPEPDPFFTGQDERMSSGRARNGRVAGSHAMPRQKRQNALGAAAGSSPRASRPQEGGGRSGPTSIAAELAGWASSELPGQAAHRFTPHLPSGHYGHTSDTAAWPNGGLSTEGGI